jgi:hypothetical protein
MGQMQYPFGLHLRVVPTVFAPRHMVLSPISFLPASHIHRYPTFSSHPLASKPCQNRAMHDLTLSFVAFHAIEVENSRGCTALANILVCDLKTTMFLNSMVAGRNRSRVTPMTSWPPNADRYRSPSQMQPHLSESEPPTTPLVGAQFFSMPRLSINFVREARLL